MANTSVQSDITNRLTEVFNPLHLTIENESYKHSVPKGSETHFKVRKSRGVESFQKKAQSGLGLLQTTSILTSILLLRSR